MEKHRRKSRSQQEQQKADPMPASGVPVEDLVDLRPEKLQSQNDDSAKT